MLLFAAEYKQQVAILAYAIEADVHSDPTIPTRLQLEPDTLQSSLEQLLARHRDYDFVVVTTPRGNIVAKASKNAIVPVQTSERAAQSPLETLTIFKDRIVQDNAAGMLNSNQQTVIYSIPLLSPVSPLEATILPSDYAASWVAAGLTTPNRYVIGYLEAGVAQESIWRNMMPFALRYGGFVTAFVLLGFLFLNRVARSIGRPLEFLARIADQISQGQVPDKVTLSQNRNDEISDIALVLNGVIAGVHKLKSQMDADKNRLSLQVATHQKRLNAAQQEVTQTKNRLKQVAYYDPVTQLPNRNLILEQLSALINIAAREQRIIGVLLLDVANFARINETLGRQVGDIVIQAISERLIRTLRKSDLVSHDSTPDSLSRVSHDEFFIILHGINSVDDAILAGERLLEAFKDPIMVDSQAIVPQLYLGVALAPEHGVTPDNLLRASDIAAGVARNQQVSAPMLYDISMDHEGGERFQLESELRKADIERDFRLHYQPQIDTRTGKIVGAEALIRWQHPELGPIAPYKFIPIAEESGLIVPLGKWVARQAIADWQDINKNGFCLHKVSINISAVQLTDDFVPFITQIVTDSGIPPSAFELELTESLLVQDPLDVAKKLQNLRENVGVKLSIDDFGTGYSSLSYLSRFPLNELKVDRSFVVAMTEDAHAAKITGAIIAMARELGLDVVAEGVDNEEQLTMLKSMDVHLVQGFYFSKPLPKPELIAYGQSLENR
jgi:diguanylate cyclase (GGDEF)-like protein